MEPSHIHLLLNHIPILGSLFGVILLIIGMALKNKTLEVTGLATILLAALITIPTYLSGEESEHAVENLQGISEHHLEEHEEHAELSLWLMVSSGVLSLLSLIAYGYVKHLVKTTRLATVALTIIAFGTLVPLANHGGKIVHSEIRDDATNSNSTGSDNEIESEHDE